MIARGFHDFTVLVINRVGEQDSIDDLEEYALPVLQDTEEADVFGLWEAASYDLFIVDRSGLVAHAESGSYPAEDEDHDHLVELLTDFM
jgi:hypothetical protein